MLFIRGVLFSSTDRQCSRSYHYVRCRAGYFRPIIQAYVMAITDFHLLPVHCSRRIVEQRLSYSTVPCIADFATNGYRRAIKPRRANAQLFSIGHWFVALRRMPALTTFTGAA